MDRLSSVFVAAAAAVLGSCVVGAPPGFSEGDSWSVPLVAPLESDVLLVPVKINGQGPFLFMIDPDASVSSVDNGLSNELRLYTAQGMEEVTERDQKVPVFLAEAKTISVGSLTVSNRNVRVHKFGTYWAGGRRVRGVLGRDVIADSLVFAADRDRGWATIATQGNLSAPPGAVAVTYRRFFERKLAKVVIDGKHAVTMHIDLGGPSTQLWQTKIASLGLPVVGARRRMSDELGTVWEVTQGATATSVQIGGQAINNVEIVPVGDKRREEEDLDGAVGQDVLSKFNVVANWHKKTLWLSPRNQDVVATAPERIKRWGAQFEGCKNDACVSVQVIGEQPPEPAPAPVPDTAPQQPPSPPGAELRLPDPKYQLLIEREPSVSDIAYEVLIEAVDASGKPIGLPRLLVTLPAGVPMLSVPDADPNYAAAAAFKVVDVSPFARECEKTASGDRCIWQQALGG